MKNVGPIDKAVRLSIAAVLIILYALGVIKGALGIIALVIAFVLIVTSLTGFCFLYRVLGISTLRKK
ncbi:MAG: DUF2892 domain-containing protein [Actinobacteria bacterium]|nr:DUF2892 domain-containing protein [Actinomycetota bacterium]